MQGIRIINSFNGSEDQRRSNRRGRQKGHTMSVAVRNA